MDKVQENNFTEYIFVLITTDMAASNNGILQNITKIFKTDAAIRFPHLLQDHCIKTKISSMFFQYKNTKWLPTQNWKHTVFIKHIKHTHHLLLSLIDQKIIFCDCVN
jgi:hypothetical protein